MKIWLISLFDPTPIDGSAAGRIKGLAEECVEEGHEVTQFTSTFRHRSKQHRFDESTSLNISPNYTVEYIRSIGYRHNMLPKRFFAHSDFAEKLEKKLDSMEKPDIILFTLPPLSVGKMLSDWARRNRVPLVADIIDPWPDSFIKDIPKSIKGAARIVIQPFFIKLRKSLESVNAISGISREYVNWAISSSGAEKNITSHVFYPAVDFSETQRLLSKHPPRLYTGDGPINIIYAGSLASSYDLPCILKAAEICNTQLPGKTIFKIAGTGPQEKLIRDYDHLPNLKYLGWLDKEELFFHYSQSDLGLIQHKNSLTQTVTYKLFSYLGAGIPVLNSLQSEMVQIIEDNKVGLNNKEGDVKKLLENIIFFIERPKQLTKYKQNALSLTQRKGDTKIVYNRMAAFLSDISEKYSVGKTSSNF